MPVDKKKLKQRLDNKNKPDTRSDAKRMVDETNASLKAKPSVKGQVPGSSIIENEQIIPQNVPGADAPSFMDSVLDAIKRDDDQAARELLNKNEGFVTGVLPEALQADAHRSSIDQMVGRGPSNRFRDAALKIEDTRQGFDIEQERLKGERDQDLAESTIAERSDRLDLDNKRLKETKRVNSANIGRLEAMTRAGDSEQTRKNLTESRALAQDVIDNNLKIYAAAKKIGDAVQMKQAIQEMKHINNIYKNHDLVIRNDLRQYIDKRLDRE